MMEAKNYYSLTFLGSNAWHDKGDVMKSDSPVLTIGESADCDVRYEKPQGCADELYYAKIITVDAKDRKWGLVRQSLLVPVVIAGKEEFTNMASLQDGDIIEFGEQKMALRFSAHHDTKYTQAGTAVFKGIGGNHIIYFLLSLFALSLIGIGVYLYTHRPKTISIDDVAYMESAIFRIDVDSVQFIRIVEKDTFCVESFFLTGDKPSGTAFLTKDGYLITARHCIEYWLGEDDPRSIEAIERFGKHNVVHWVADAETFNYMREDRDTMYALRSFCTLYDKDGIPRKSFSSSTADDTNIDRSRDGIYPIDNFHQIYYWRSITPRFQNRSMEIGDIFCMPMDIAGVKSQIELADKERIMALMNEDPLFFFGYSDTEKGNGGLKSESGMVKEDYQNASNQCDHNIVHNGNLNYGFSGGPVIARDSKGGGFVIVGVVSKCDNRNSHLQMSVPVAVIKKGDIL